MCQLIWLARSLFLSVIVTLGCVSTFGQSITRNVRAAERSSPATQNSQALAARKLPFEQSIIIYYNAPAKAPDAAVSTSSPIRSEATRSVSPTVPRIQAQPNAAQQQTKNLGALEPIVIYYPSSPKANVRTTASSLTPKDSGPKTEPMVRTKPGLVDLSVIKIESKQPSPIPAFARTFPRVNASQTEHLYSAFSSSSGERINSTANETALGSSLAAATATATPSVNLAQENRPVQSADMIEPTVEKTADKTESPKPLTGAAAAAKESSDSASASSEEIAFDNANSADDPIAMNNYAVAMTMDAKYGEAESLLEKAIAAQPRNAKFHRNLSVVFERTNRLDEALVSARTAASLAPQDPLVLEQLCVLELGHGSPASAADCYEKLNASKPLDVLAQAYYGTALFRSGKIKESEPILEKAAQATPPLAEALNALGVMYFTTKRIDEAIAAFKNGVEADPELCDVRYNLGIAYLSIHNKAGALSQYNILKSTNSKFADQLYRALFSDKLVFVNELKSNYR